MVDLKNLRVKEIISVSSFKTKNAKWEVKNSKYCALQVKIHGKAIHNFNDRKLTVTDNCIYFLNQNEDHEVEIFEDDHELSSIAVYFTTYEPIETESFCVKLNNISEIVNLFSKIETQKALTSKGDNLMLSYFYRLCAIFEDMRQREYSPRDMRMVMAREYIDLHFFDKTCIEDATTESHLSRRRFNELFKKQFNITPNRYLTSRRIEYATQLLKTVSYPLSEISELCGFGDIYYFCKVFKSETGYSPGKYRNEYR